MSRVLSKLGIFDKRFFARKLKIKKVDSTTSRNFLIDNHLQGYTQSSFNIGLFNDNEMLSLMTFGKPRFNKNYEWELIRYCSKKNLSIIGGASKPKSILTYSDRLWGDSNFYEKLGFKFKNKNIPGYSYYVEGYPKRMSRMAFQFKNFEKTFDIAFDKSISEEENAKRVNAYRIYDCGQNVYEMILPTI